MIYTLRTAMAEQGFVELHKALRAYDECVKKKMWATLTVTFQGKVVGRSVTKNGQEEHDSWELHLRVREIEKLDKDSIEYRRLGLVWDKPKGRT